MAIKVLRVFVSSPGDVAEERLIARRVIGRLEAQFGDAVHLEPIFWEQEPLLATASFQEQLPRPSAADVSISILWSRLGTALPGSIRRADGSGYSSGTEFEFEDALDGFRRTGKPKMLAYRKTAPPAWPTDDELAAQRVAQKLALERFCTHWFVDSSDGTLKAAFHPFESPADFEELLETHLTRIIEHSLKSLGTPPTAVKMWREGSPFRGLEAFELEHAPIFFGRTAAVGSVLMKLRRQAERGAAFVLIVGMSGGGKSSLARAGVMPLMLQPGVLGTAQEWRYATMRPSDGQGDLTSALLQALAQPSALPEWSAADPLAYAQLRELLQRDPQAFAASVAARLTMAESTTSAPAAEAVSTCHLALLVDQLEEIFSDERIDLQQREQFAAALDALARSGKVWIVATVRSDQYPRLLELPILVSLKEGDGQFDLLPPTLREIGQIIRLPAAAAGLRFETHPYSAEKLDETIRDAAPGNAAALPLLQFLLEELYKRRSNDNVLTYRAYEELGGVAGALAKRAEEVFQGVSVEARETMPLLLRELVSLSVEDDSKPLRRFAPLAEFTSAPVRELLDALLLARLFVTNLDDRGEPVVSVAHEALLEQWPRMRSWREQNREDLRAHARLAAAVRAWERESRSRDFLLARGKPLAEARSLVMHGVRLSASEKALVEISDRRERRFRRWRTAAVAGLIVLAISASVAAYLANRESNRARIQASTSQRTTDFLVSLFSIADPGESRGQTVTVREVLDRGVDEIKNSLSTEPAVRTNLVRAMGQAYNGLGLYPKGKLLLRQAVADAERGGRGDGLIRARIALGFNHYMDGEYPEASATYRQALLEAQALHGEKNELVAASLAGLADSVFEEHDAAEAERLYRRALAIDLELHGERNADTARTVHDLGILLYYQARYPEAEALYRRSLGIYRSLYGENHPSVAQGLNDLAVLLYDNGHFDAAIRTYKEAVPIYRKIYGEEHPEFASGLYNLGRVLLITGDTAGAEQLLRQVLAIDRQRLAPHHEDLILPLNSLGMVGLAKNQPEEAETFLTEALANAREHQHWMLNQILTNLADVHVRTHHLSDAGAALEEARKTLDAQYGESLQSTDAWRVAILDSVAGSYESERARFSEAGEFLRTACPALEARFGARSYFGNQCTQRLNRLHELQGKTASAH